jgi:hypothetical protein
MIPQYKEFSKLVTDIGVDVGLTLKGVGVLSSNDKDTRQVASNIVSTCEDLLTRFPWRHAIGTDPWVMKVDGSFTDVLAEDTDTPMFDSTLLKLGGTWRYLNAKGLSYAEPFRFYEKRISDFAFLYNGHNVVDVNDASSAA